MNRDGLQGARLVPQKPALLSPAGGRGANHLTTLTSVFSPAKGGRLFKCNNRSLPTLNVKVQEWACSLAIRMPAYHVGVPGLNICLCSNSSLLLVQTWEGSTGWPHPKDLRPWRYVESEPVSGSTLSASKIFFKTFKYYM